MAGQLCVMWPRRPLEGACTMLKKLVLSLAALSGLAALPTAAQAGGYGRSYYDGGYAPRYGYAPRHYAPAYYPRGYYVAPRYGYAYAPRRHRGYAYRDYGYRDYGYRDRHYGRGYRCGSGTTGAIVGGAAGALLGREVGRGGRHGYYGYRRGGGTAGAIIGGAAGALIGRELGRRC